MVASIEDIKTPEDIKTWFNELVAILNISIHPDNDFEDYVNRDGKQSFDNRTCKEMNEMMEKCFDVAHNEQVCIYGIAIDILNK